MAKSMEQNQDPKLSIGSNHCLCSLCGEYLGGVRAYEMHRAGVGVGVSRDRACLPPSGVSDKQGRSLLKLNSTGHWVRYYKGQT